MDIPRPYPPRERSMYEVPPRWLPPSSYPPVADIDPPLSIAFVGEIPGQPGVKHSAFGLPVLPEIPGAARRIRLRKSPAEHVARGDRDRQHAEHPGIHGVGCKGREEQRDPGRKGEQELARQDEGLGLDPLTVSAEFHHTAPPAAVIGRVLVSTPGTVPVPSAHS